MSKLVRALRLVNLAGRTLLHGPLKLRGFFVAELWEKARFVTYGTDLKLGW